MPFAATWMALESITLSEISQRQLLYDMIYVESKNYAKLVNKTKRSRFTEIDNQLGLPVVRAKVGGAM